MSERNIFNISKHISTVLFSFDKWCDISPNTSRLLLRRKEEEEEEEGEKKEEEEEDWRNSYIYQNEDMGAKWFMDE